MTNIAIIKTNHLLTSLDWNLQYHSCVFVIEARVGMMEKLMLIHCFLLEKCHHLLTDCPDDRVVQTPEN